MFAKPVSLFQRVHESWRTSKSSSGYLFTSDPLRFDLIPFHSTCLKLPRMACQKQTSGSGSLPSIQGFIHPFNHRRPLASHGRRCLSATERCVLMNNAFVFNLVCFKRFSPSSSSPHQQRTAWFYSTRYLNDRLFLAKCHRSRSK